jgi:hypothetical protein
MLVTATATDITYQFYNADGILIDEHRVSKNCAALTTTSRSDSVPTVVLKYMPR